MLEELVIEHCAPTLAGIKTGSMFSLKLEGREDINEEIRRLNNLLTARGVRVIPLKRTEAHVLIYLYRPDCLKKDLCDPAAIHILEGKGYDCSNSEGCIVQLVQHLKSDDIFPHEIGLFLGYPPSDVACFIMNPREGVKCCGCWKAYSEPEKAKKTFSRFLNCTKAYRRLNKSGKTLAQLTVITDKELAG